jgi:hypothetical protein
MMRLRDRVEDKRGIPGRRRVTNNRKVYREIVSRQLNKL